MHGAAAAERERGRERERERERERDGAGRGSRDALRPPSPRRILPYVTMPQAVAAATTTTIDRHTERLFSSDKTERIGRGVDMIDVVRASGLKYNYVQRLLRTVRCGG